MKESFGLCPWFEFYRVMFILIGVNALKTNFSGVFLEHGCQKFLVFFVF